MRQPEFGANRPWKRTRCRRGGGMSIESLRRNSVGVKNSSQRPSGRGLQPVADATVQQRREALERDRAAGAVGEEVFEPLAVVGVQVHPGVEREALDEGRAPPRPGRIGEARHLHRLDRLGIPRVERVDRVLGLFRQEQPAQLPRDAQEDLVDLLVRGRPRRDETDARLVADEHPVGYGAVEVQVQVEAPPKA